MRHTSSNAAWHLLAEPQRRLRERERLDALPEAVVRDAEQREVAVRALAEHLRRRRPLLEN